MNKRLTSIYTYYIIWLKGVIYSGEYQKEVSLFVEFQNKLDEEVVGEAKKEIVGHKII